MVLVKNLKAFHVFIFGKINQQNVFDDILERKKAFLDSKMKTFKIRRIGIFPEELVHGFGKKFEILPRFYFWEDQPAKCVWRCSRKSKGVFRL